jgi:hypothetical protein
MSTQELIEDLKKQGYDVYGPQELTSYVFFTDGTRIGYAQHDNMRGRTYTTVHVPNRHTGTGFQVQDARAALAFAPDWAYQRDRDSVMKYQDFEHFRRRHWQPLVQY